MTSTIRSITFDCSDPELVANFWAETLGYNLTDKDEEGALVEGPGGPRLLFLKVPEGKVVKNRVHLDLQPTTSMQEEVERLEGLGARNVRLIEEDSSRFTVMQDPEGNEFCVERSARERES